MTKIYVDTWRHQAPMDWQKIHDYIYGDLRINSKMIYISSKVCYEKKKLKEGQCKIITLILWWKLVMHYTLISDVAIPWSLAKDTYLFLSSGRHNYVIKLYSWDWSLLGNQLKMSIDPHTRSWQRKSGFMISLMQGILKYCCLIYYDLTMPYVIGELCHHWLR